MTHLLYLNSKWKKVLAKHGVTCINHELYHVTNTKKKRAVLRAFWSVVECGRKGNLFSWLSKNVVSSNHYN